MADKKDMDANYSFLDKIFRLSIGEMADFTNAFYEGDFSLPLDQAQRRKHNFIKDALRIDEKSRVLDMGCGWGPFLNYLREISVQGIGVTLSDGQARSCRKNGLDVHMMDMREITKDTFGSFDAVTCLGAVEHLCSVPEWQAGKQEEVYRNFFKTVYNLLPPGGRFYVQTMTFGRNMIPYSDFNIDADKTSDEYIIALMEIAQPGSWLPESIDQVIGASKGMFKVIDKINGRLDYIETITQWKKRFRRFQLEKYLIFLSLIPRFLKDPEFRYQYDILVQDPNKKCFERELMDHYRLVFERV